MIVRFAGADLPSLREYLDHARGPRAAPIDGDFGEAVQTVLQLGLLETGMLGQGRWP